jgi:hypothetical protein
MNAHAKRLLSCVGGGLTFQRGPTERNGLDVVFIVFIAGGLVGTSEEMLDELTKAQNAALRNKVGEMAAYLGRLNKHHLI